MRGLEFTEIALHITPIVDKTRQVGDLEVNQIRGMELLAYVDIYNTRLAYERHTIM